MVTNKFNFASCLVATTPADGWGVDVAIKGVEARVHGSTPLEVFHELEDRLKANGLQDFNSIDLWCNLNIMWMNRIHDRHHKVRLSNFLQYLEPVEPEIFEKSNALRHGKEEWVPHFWGFLETFLCQRDEQYSWSSFHVALSVALGVTNPENSPIVGDAVFFQNFKTNLEKARHDPPYTQQAARAWLVKTKREITDASFETSPFWN